MIAIITARAGSKRLPGKNLRELMGRPLVWWTIRAAIESDCFNDSEIILSTDSPEIARIGEDEGISVPGLRPAELATDTAKSADTVLHVCKNLSYPVESFCLLQPTSPCRDAIDIALCYCVFMRQEGTHPVVASRLNDTKVPCGAVYMHNFGTFREDPDHNFCPNSTIFLPLPRNHDIDIDTIDDFAAAQHYLMEKKQNRK